MDDARITSGSHPDPATAATRRALLIAGVEVLDDGAYDAIVEMERAAIDAGYPALA